MDAFNHAINHWFDQSKLALKNLPPLKEELSKRQKLVQVSEYNATFLINMVNVCGTYAIVGGNPDTKDSYYTGTLQIELLNNQIVATWLIDGSQPQNGYGFVFNNTLVLQFKYHANADLFHGIVAYEFLTPEIVNGKWTEEMAFESAFEMGRKLPSSELDLANPEPFFSAN